MSPTSQSEIPRRWSFSLWNPKRDIRLLKGLVIAAVVVAALITIKDELLWQSDSAYLGSTPAAEDEQEIACNVAALELRGNLVTYVVPPDSEESDDTADDATPSELLVYGIEKADKDPAIKAIVLEIDSYGGLPVAAEEVSLALQRASKPTIALIREAGVSAAYWAATGADIIFASRNSDVGGIGVTMSYLNNSGKNQDEGLSYVSLSSAKFKDAGDPDKPLTADERTMLMRDINILHRYFVEVVAKNRKLDVASVEKIADGSTMLGQMALDNGLIDRIGDMYDVSAYLRNTIGEEPEICWY